MKLYIVIYIAGLMDSAFGPVPFDEAECKRHVEYNMTDPTKPPWRDSKTGRVVPREQVELHCEWHNKHPEKEVGWR
jgi:hypothetical protein